MAIDMAAQYKKWDDFDDELEDLDEDANDGFELNSGMDLNALTGPAEEVKMIKAHWRREGRRLARSSQKPPNNDHRQKSIVPEPGPMQERPCVTSEQRLLEQNYKKWNKFDADAAMLEIDNADTTEEGKAMRLSAGQGSAMLNCEGYTKDREEYDLDQDIERNMGGLKQLLAQNLKDASQLKMEGNTMLRAGQAKEAADQYRKGIETLQLARQASVLMSASLADKQSQLLADLNKNLAAAQLAISDFSGALASADEALTVSDDEKARYRRAVALVRLKRLDEARKEVEKLDSSDPAVQKLKSELK
ncbi:unnamed protein product [Effrenium voratum]|uniref:Tetratricopeptide repeat protein n=1 Tax=Effrenium voratum TaxID=2562239 RepID=A0AA36HL78_9DINO|nr:unnamed protein product [Effrenium voratum]CAJ1446252.1 unnamed protein product [Effrenium voratum]